MRPRMMKLKPMKLIYSSLGLLLGALLPIAKAGVYSIHLQPSQGPRRFVEQSIPSGVVVTSISHGGTLDAHAEKIKWGPLDPIHPSTLTFTLLGEPADQSLPHQAFPSASLNSDHVAFEKDSDGDGVVDRLEIALGTPVEQANHGLDTDGDGLSDLEEIMAATDPNNPESVIAIESFETEDGDLLKLSVRLPEGMLAIVETTHDLSEPTQWKAQSGVWNQLPDEGISEFTFESTSWTGLEFIRVRIAVGQ